MNEKEKEKELLKQAFEALLYNDEYYNIIRMVNNKIITYSRALKIAADRTSNLYRKQEYINLSKYAFLIGF